MDEIVSENQKIVSKFRVGASKPEVKQVLKTDAFLKIQVKNQNSTI